MQDNPYMAMLNGIKKQAQAGTFPTFRTGVVVSVSPLAINAGGIPLSGADLLVNADLLPRIRQVRFTEPSGTVKASATGAASGKITLDISEADIVCTQTEQGGTLAAGDRVALLTEDNDVFVVVCKVVSV